uniref:Toluene transport protein, putative n=1 Tax=Chlorobium chlorochromatii (strain CaD3) TaxID=340177 RepID=Q3AQI3_CHLCH
MKKTTSRFAMACCALLCAPYSAFATNGMNLEGYGAISHALGGTGSAYNTGNSGVSNNPATLALRKSKSTQLGFGLRGLHPDVSLQANGISQSSAGDAYYMPSLSWMHKGSAVTWGVAMLAQGGMGTEYGKGSPLFSMGKPLSGVGMVPMSGEEIRTEVGVGRVMFPIAWNVSENTTIGASFDVVWAGMDLMMDMDGAHFASMMGSGNVNGTMATTLGTMMAPGGGVTDVNYVRYNFSNNNAFWGEASGYGTGFKLGITHRLSKVVTVGGSFQSKTAMSDLKATKAELSFAGVDGTGSTFTQKVNGTIKVRNFEWPTTIAAGVALYPSDRWMVAADVKHLGWASVMRSFSTSFEADNTAANGGFAGQELEVAMKQDWDDQTVFGFGVQYRASDRLVLRSGASFSSNPVPNAYLNPMFPATTENHYTAGFGYRLSDAATIALAGAWVPKVSARNGDGVEVHHSQTNWSLNYTQAL